MTINQSGWRPTAPEASDEAPQTFTGNRALMLEEPLLFEIGDTQTTGVDFEDFSSPAKAGAETGSETGPRP
jgi:glycine dehydrogenase subunit 2